MILIIHRSFEKKFKKLHLNIKEKFRERRDLLLKDPFNPLLNNHPLGGDREGQWSININGDWRVIYEFKTKDMIVFIDIDTHANLYG